MADRIVHCRMKKQDLPGLDRPPFKNELGQKIFAEVSKDAWAQWLKDSVKYINTAGYDLSTPAGQKAWLDICAKYFGFVDGEMPATAFVPKDSAP
jgi:Fe-S cluster biosynthesis and repair protein YggX